MDADDAWPRLGVRDVSGGWAIVITDRAGGETVARERDIDRSAALERLQRRAPRLRRVWRLLEESEEHGRDIWFERLVLTDGRAVSVRRTPAGFQAQLLNDGAWAAPDPDFIRAVAVAVQLSEADARKAITPHVNDLNDGLAKRFDEIVLDPSIDPAVDD